MRNIPQTPRPPVAAEDVPLTAAEVAMLLRCSPGMVKKLCRKGELEGAEVVLGKWLVPRASVEAFKKREARRPHRTVRRDVVAGTLDRLSQGWTS